MRTQNRKGKKNERKVRMTPYGRQGEEAWGLKEAAKVTRKEKERAQNEERRASRRGERRKKREVERE